MDESDNMPLENVKAEFVQTDNDGFYFKENTTWNPRLFAYLLTDSKGEFVIHTIRPGQYKDDDQRYIPAHIHFTLKKDGFRIYGGEFTFEDDPVFMVNGNIEQIPVAGLIENKKPKQYYVTIPMQKE